MVYLYTGKMVKTSWIRNLKKEELVALAEEFQIDSSGTVDELRKRLSDFTSAADSAQAQQRLRELEQQHSRSPSPSPAYLEIPCGSKSVQLRGQQSAERRVGTIVMEAVRKWPARFSGKEDPIGFIEAIEELAEAYEINLDAIPKVMAVLLVDRGLLWYRNNNRRWTEWSLYKRDFLRYFLPSRFYEDLEDRIRQRHQQPKEKFKDYALEMQELMRHTDMSQERCLERTFRNMAYDYQMYIRRHDFRSLEELTDLAGEYELIQENARPTRHNEPRERVVLGQSPRGTGNTRHDHERAAVVQPSTRRGCLICNDTSHWRRDCPNLRGTACQVCGREGVRTSNCCRGRQPGNANRRSPNRRD